MKHKGGNITYDLVNICNFLLFDISVSFFFAECFNSFSRLLQPKITYEVFKNFKPRL